MSQRPPPPPSGRSPSPAPRGRITTPRLYLTTPLLDDAAGFARELEAALDSADIAAVLLRLAEADERTLINRAKSVATLVQRRDVALLLDNRPELVARVGADGAHLTGVETFAAAVALLKPDRIAGCGGLRSRHDAMLAAETGADYVMFGEPDRAGRRAPAEEVEERLAWWAELVELPCVGYAANRDEVKALAQIGVDFIALGEWIWTEPEGAAATVKAVAADLADPASQ
ncbi:MAG: thiamine phosphate synthase [Xanthobacteraceae bacterium]